MATEASVTPSEVSYPILFMSSCCARKRRLLSKIPKVSQDPAPLWQPPTPFRFSHLIRDPRTSRWPFTKRQIIFAPCISTQPVQRKTQTHLLLFIYKLCPCKWQKWVYGCLGYLRKRLCSDICLIFSCCYPLFGSDKQECHWNDQEFWLVQSNSFSIQSCAVCGCGLQTRRRPRLWWTFGQVCYRRFCHRGTEGNLYGNLIQVWVGNYGCIQFGRNPSAGLSLQQFWYSWSLRSYDSSHNLLF